MTIVLAHVLPLMFGAWLYVALIEFPRRTGGWLRTLGYGYLLGLAAVALLMAVLQPTPTGSFAALSIVLVVTWALGSVALWLRRRPTAVISVTQRTEPAWTRWLLLILAGWLLWRGSSLMIEIASRPMFPWDAWTTWAAKAKTWYLGDAWRSFVDFNSWMRSPEDRHIAAWFYPDSLPLLEVWFASAAGVWSAPVVLSAWPCLWLAGSVLLIGQLRALGATWILAAGAGFVWASLPLVQTHVALAGYADLAVAVVFGAAALALARFAAGHGWRHLLLALMCTLMLPGIKQEGALWLLVLGAGMVHAVLPVRWRGWMVLGFAVGLLLWIVLFGIRLPLPGLGWVEAGWGYLRVPSSQMVVDLIWRPVLPDVLESLLLTPNWHLLWWLSPVVLAMTVPAWHRQATMDWVMLLGFALIMFVFFFTDAAQWAKDLTAINRVLMQLTLAWVGWLSLLLIAAKSFDSADEHVMLVRHKTGATAA